MQMLETLASLVMDELENRVAAKKAIRAQSDLLNFTIHDLKNPTSTILLASQLLSKEASGHPHLVEMANTVEESAERILSQINNLMYISRIENSEFTLKKEKTDLRELLETIQYNFHLQAQQKKQKIHLEIHSDSDISIDRNRILEVLENLVSNAIKYSYPGTDIRISLASAGSKSMIIGVSDQGQGLNEEDQKKLLFQQNLLIS